MCVYLPSKKAIGLWYGIVLRLCDPSDGQTWIIDHLVPVGQFIRQFIQKRKEVTSQLKTNTYIRYSEI